MAERLNCMEAEMMNEDMFKYIQSRVQSNGVSNREVKMAGWSGWYRVVRAICDRRVSARVCLEAWTLTKEHGRELEDANVVRVMYVNEIDCVG